MDNKILSAIAEAGARRRAANQCTKDNPMPKVRDQMGQSWYHVDAKPKEGYKHPLKPGDITILHCPNCGLDFPVTVGKL